MKENNFRYKVLSVVAYFIAVYDYPILIIALFIFLSDEDFKIHLNRCVFLCFVKTILFVIEYRGYSIEYFSVNTFGLIIALAGMIQILFDNKSYIFLTDKIKLVPSSSWVDSPLWRQIVSTIILIAVSCIVRC